jgi:hypothetical protein
MYKVHSAKSCSGGDTPARGRSNQSKFPIKSLMSSISQSFITSGKQGGKATVLREGCDIVTRETCIPTSLNLNNLGKASELHLTFLLSSAAGAVPNLSLQII